jgi:tellurite resistance protein
MRARAERETRRRALCAATGIDDDWVLEALLARGIDERSVEGFALLPLAEVAWADGKVEATERAAALEAVRQRGVATEGRALLEVWLTQPPDDSLRDVWRAFAAARVMALDASQRDQWRRDLLEQARSVALASGGVLGFGSRVSGAEDAALRGIEAALS